MGKYIGGPDRVAILDFFCDIMSGRELRSSPRVVGGNGSFESIDIGSESGVLHVEVGVHCSVLVEFR